MLTNIINLSHHAQLGVGLGRAPAFLIIPRGCRHVHLHIQRDREGKMPLVDDSALVSIFPPWQWWHSLLQSLAAVVVFPLCTKHPTVLDVEDVQLNSRKSQQLCVVRKVSSATAEV